MQRKHFLLFLLLKFYTCGLGVPSVLNLETKIIPPSDGLRNISITNEC